MRGILSLFCFCCTFCAFSQNITSVSLKTIGNLGVNLSFKDKSEDSIYFDIEVLNLSDKMIYFHLEESNLALASSFCYDVADVVGIIVGQCCDPLTDYNDISVTKIKKNKKINLSCAISILDWYNHDVNLLLCFSSIVGNNSSTSYIKKVNRKLFMNISIYNENMQRLEITNLNKLSLNILSH